MSRILQAIERSYLDARMNTPEYTLTVPKGFRISNCKKLTKIVGSCKLTEFGIQGQNRNHGETLTPSNFWIASFKLLQANTEFQLENLKQILTIAIYDIA